MILVDTNVWSELQRPHPDARVQAWEIANASKLWLSTVVLGELLSGVELMSAGRRKSALVAAYEGLLALYADRIAGFDLTASRHYATTLAFLHGAGRNPGTADAQIAATALSRGLALATRNVRHFDGLGLTLIDPWIA